MPRGRTFDKSATAEAAIDLFWSRGYSGVSMQDIAAATGVGNGSIYLAFGSKWELFLDAFRQYCARRVQLVRGALPSAPATTERVLVDYFEAIIADCAGDPDRRGCLLINTIAELGNEAAVAELANDTIAQMERELIDALTGAVDAGADAEAISAAAAQAVSLSQSLILVSRLGRTEDELSEAGRSGARSIACALRAA